MKEETCKFSLLLVLALTCFYLKPRITLAMLGILSSFPYYYRAEAIKKANGMLFSEEVLFCFFVFIFSIFLCFFSFVFAWGRPFSFSEM